MSETIEIIFDNKEENDILIEKILEKKKLQLSKLSEKELNKILEKAKRAPNKNNKYMLEIYNFKTKEYNFINNFKTNDDIKAYLTEHNIIDKLNLLIKTKLINIQKLS